VRVCVQLESLRCTGPIDPDTQLAICNLMHLHTLHFRIAHSSPSGIKFTHFPASLTDLDVGCFVETMIPMVRALSGLRRFALRCTMLSKDEFNSLFAAGQLFDSLEYLELEITWKKPISMIEEEDMDSDPNEDTDPDEIDTTNVDFSHLQNLTLLSSRLAPIVATFALSSRNGVRIAIVRTLRRIEVGEEILVSHGRAYSSIDSRVGAAVDSLHT